MGIRFPDLQVLFPRASEPGRVQAVQGSGNPALVHAQAEEIVRERQRRAAAISEARDTGEAVLRSRRDERRRGRDRRAGTGGSPGGELGRHIDIKA